MNWNHVRCSILLIQQSDAEPYAALASSPSQCHSYQSAFTREWFIRSRITWLSTPASLPLPPSFRTVLLGSGMSHTSSHLCHTHWAWLEVRSHFFAQEFPRRLWLPQVVGHFYSIGAVLKKSFLFSFSLSLKFSTGLYSKIFLQFLWYESDCPVPWNPSRDKFAICASYNWTHDTFLWFYKNVSSFRKPFLCTKVCPSKSQ